MRTLIFQIKGSFYQDTQNLLVSENIGKKVSLHPEPDNPSDRNAILVKMDGNRVGYVPKTRTSDVREFINSCDKCEAVLITAHTVQLKEVIMQYRIIPKTVEVKSGKVYFGDELIPRCKIHDIGDGMHIIVTDNSYIVSGRSAEVFEVLDFKYKVLPRRLFVFEVKNDKIVFVDRMSPIEYVRRAVKANPGLSTFRKLGTFWGEFKGVDFNPRNGMPIHTDDEGRITVRFKEKQVAARLQLYRASNMPYIGIVIGGYNLDDVWKRTQDVNPLDTKDDAIAALKLVMANSKFHIVPSSPDSALGSLVHKFNVMGTKNPYYPPNEESTLYMKVWNSQAKLGLGDGAIRCRAEIQDYLEDNTILRTQTINVSEEVFHKILDKRDKAVGKRAVHDDREMVLTNVAGEKVNIFTCVGDWHPGIDHAVIKHIDGVYNQREDAYYMKFYVDVVYKRARTGDKILSFGKEFVKGTLVIDENIDSSVDMEGTWENVKGSEYDVIKETKEYTVIEINPSTVQITERGMSNAKFVMSGASTDAFELMSINYYFPALANQLSQCGDPRLKWFSEAVNCFINRRPKTTKYDSTTLIQGEIAKFIKHQPSIFTETDKYYAVKVKDVIFPMPHRDLIMAMANEYETGVNHHYVVIEYMRMVRQFILSGTVNHGKALKIVQNKYRVMGLAYFTATAERQLYKFFARPKLDMKSSIKRVLNHMEHALHTIAAVRDNDSILGGKDAVYCMASIYPSVHPLQVKHKIIKVLPLRRFRKMFYEYTGRNLYIDSLGDSVLMSPDLVNDIYLKDNDGDGMSLRVLPDQKSAQILFMMVTGDFNKSLHQMRHFFDKTGLWEKQKPKEKLPEVVLSDDLILNAMDTGISTKLMIGIITRAARRVIYAMMKTLSETTNTKDRTELLAAIMYISKGEQDVIDGLKHETEMINAIAIHDFLRSFIRFDFEEHREDILMAFGTAGFRKGLWNLLPRVKHNLTVNMSALNWLFGDPLKTHKEPGVAIKLAQLRFLDTFQNLHLLYYDKPVDREKVNKFIEKAITGRK